MLNSEEISVDKIKSGIGGYKKKATKEFVETVRNDYEALCKENLELKDKLAILSEGVQYYKNMEKSLQKALVLAERTTSETMHAAEVKAVAMEKEAKARADVVKKEAKIEAENYEKEAAAKAERMIREAKEQADMAIAEGNEELRRIHSKIMNLIQQYEQYKSQYKQLALAQMNVLESEAYNLDAPILKTLQRAVEQGEESKEKKKVQEEIQQDEVIQPIPVMEESGFTEPEQQKGKKVYVDARGEVVEVHEFREVTIPHSGLDPFKDDEMDNQDDADFFRFAKDKGVERFDDDDDDDNMHVTNMSENDAKKLEKTEALNNIVEISKPQVENVNDTQAFNFKDEKNDKIMSTIDELSVEHSRNGIFETLDENKLSSTTNIYDEKKLEKDASDELNVNDISSTTSEEYSQKSAAAMREIERMQLERLRREEEEHAKALQQAQERKSYFTMGSSANVSSESEKPEGDFRQNVVSDSENLEKDFYQNVTFGNEKPEISLHDIKLQEEEQNKHVPLPKASDENLYFSDDANNVNVSEGKRIISEEEILSTKISNQEQQAQVDPFADAERKAKAMQASDIAEEVLQYKREDENSFFNQVMNSKNETGSFFAQFSNQADGNVQEIQNEENRNSLDFELDFNNGMPTTQNKESGFKSFRDFESEL